MLGNNALPGQKWCLVRIVLKPASIEALQVCLKQLGKYLWCSTVSQCSIVHIYRMNLIEEMKQVCRTKA